MNERFKNLLTPQLIEWGADSGDNFSEEIEKFAESIVKEMCDMLSQCADDCYLEDASEIDFGYISQLQDWVERFKKYFDISEI